MLPSLKALLNAQKALLQKQRHTRMKTRLEARRAPSRPQTASRRSTAAISDLLAALLQVAEAASSLQQQDGVAPFRPATGTCMQTPMPGGARSGPDDERRLKISRSMQNSVALRLMARSGEITGWSADLNPH